MTGCRAGIGRLGVVVAVVGMAIAGCGDDGGDEARDRKEVVASFATINGHLSERDVEATCRWLTPTAQYQVGAVGHRLPTSCRRDVRDFFKSVGRRGQADPRISNVSVDGDRATVVASYEGERSGAFVFEESGGRWKLGSIFSVTATSPVDLGTPIPKLPFLDPEAVAGPAAEASPVSIGGREGPCSRLEFPNRHTVGGGCELTAVPATIRLRLRSLFGTSLFGDCTVAFTMKVAASGRVGVDDGGVGYGSDLSKQSGCGDMDRCRVRLPDNEGPRLPWQGQIWKRANGRVGVELALCFDSCAGRLQGRTHMEMVRGKRGWLLRAADSPVGRSGLSLDGTWRLETEQRDLSVRKQGRVADIDRMPGDSS